MTTIADVAARAGVGIGTVSRVLNGSSQVRPETRVRVQQAMDELEYQPSRTSRRARRDHGGYVGVLVHFFEGPSAYQRLRGVVTRLQPHGFEVVLFIVDSPERARDRLVELPRNQQLDGLIVMSLPLRADEGEWTAPWVAAGWAEVAGGVLRLTPLGWLRLDALAASLTARRSR